MNKDTLKAIFTMLETGSDAQLAKIKTELLIALDGATTQAARYEIRFALRLLGEEMTARGVISQTGSEG